MEGDMTEQEKFEAYANTQGYSVEKDDQGLYRSVETFCHHCTWQAAIASREPMPLEKAEEIAHRTASRYTHKSDKSFTAYTFLPHTLNDFVRMLEKHHGIG
jgi:hypothetical protein